MRPVALRDCGRQVFWLRPAKCRRQAICYSAAGCLFAPCSLAAGHLFVEYERISNGKTEDDKFGISDAGVPGTVGKWAICAVHAAGDQYAVDDPAGCGQCGCVACIGAAKAL